MADRKQGRRSAQTAEETKMHILCVAGNMFCTSGYEKVSLRNISDAAGVSHSLIRHHFGSKEQIWYAISDALHEYMEKYISELIRQLPVDKPANLSLYHFATKLLAHTLIVPYPIQFAADAVRQEGEFFDYFIDQHGNFQETMLELTELHNSENPDFQINMFELKWQLILFAHGAHSLNPMMKQIWIDKTTDADEVLYNHWNLFNRQLASYLNIAKEDYIQPNSLKDLLLPLACEFEQHCQEYSE